MASLLTDARSLGATLLSKLQPGASGTDKTQSVAQMRNFVAEPAAVRTATISTFVIAELARRKELFGTFTAQLPRLPLGLNQWRLQWLTFATTVNCQLSSQTFLDFGAQCGVALLTGSGFSGVSPCRQTGVVSRWGNLQHRADRLDCVCRAMNINEVGHGLNGRSGSACAK